MAIGEPRLPPLRPVPGVRLGTASAGIRQTERDDVAIIELQEEAVCGAVFTRNEAQQWRLVSLVCLPCALFQA